MITSSLGRIVSFSNVKCLEVSNDSDKALRFQEGVKLFAHANELYKELYLSTVNLDSKLSALTTVVEDQPGVIADLSSFLGKEGINIVQSGYFTIGASGIGETVFRHPPPVDIGLLKTRMIKILKKMKKLKYIRKIYPKPITTLMPFLDAVDLFSTSAEVVHGRISLPADVFQKLKLEDKKYLALVTQYTRFPMVIVKLLTDPDKVVWIGATLTHEPLVLGPVCESIRRSVNVLCLSMNYIKTREATSDNRVRLSLFCGLRTDENPETVKACLASVNSGSRPRLVDSGSIECLPIAEYEKRVFSE